MCHTCHTYVLPPSPGPPWVPSYLSEATLTALAENVLAPGAALRELRTGAVDLADKGLVALAKNLRQRGASAHAPPPRIPHSLRVGWVGATKFGVGFHGWDSGGGWLGLGTGESSSPEGSLSECVTLCARRSLGTTSRTCLVAVFRGLAGRKVSFPLVVEPVQ